MSINLEQINEAKKVAENADQLKQAVEEAQAALQALNSVAYNTGIVIQFDIDGYNQIDFYMDGVSEDTWMSSSAYC